MLLREKITKEDIAQININIAAYQKVINFYEDYLERNGPYDYVSEQIQKLNGLLAEYLIAREMMIDKD